MPRSVRVNRASGSSRLPSHLKMRTSGRIPATNRVGHDNFGPHVVPTCFHVRGVIPTGRSEFVQSGIPEEMRDLLFQILSDEKQFPICSRDLPENKKEENVEIRGEAALLLSLYGYTRLPLIRKIQSMIDELTKENTPLEVQPVTGDLLGFILTTACQPIPKKSSYSRGLTYLLAALYNIYENRVHFFRRAPNDISHMAEIIRKYKLDEDEVRFIIGSFSPKKLKDYIDKRFPQKP